MDGDDSVQWGTFSTNLSTKSKKKKKKTHTKKNAKRAKEMPCKKIKYKTTTPNERARCVCVFCICLQKTYWAFAFRHTQKCANKIVSSISFLPVARSPDTCWILICSISKCVWNRAFGRLQGAKRYKLFRISSFRFPSIRFSFFCSVYFFVICSLNPPKNHHEKCERAHKKKLPLLQHTLIFFDCTIFSSC